MTTLPIQLYVLQHESYRGTDMLAGPNRGYEVFNFDPEMSGSGYGTGPSPSRLFAVNRSGLGTRNSMLNDDSDLGVVNRLVRIHKASTCSTTNNIQHQRRRSSISTTYLFVFSQRSLRCTVLNSTARARMRLLASHSQPSGP